MKRKMCISEGNVYVLTNDKSKINAIHHEMKLEIVCPAQREEEKKIYMYIVVAQIS